MVEEGYGVCWSSLYEGEGNTEEEEEEEEESGREKCK